MDYFTSKRVLILTIVVLVVLNLGTLVTIWFIRMPDAPPKEPVPAELPGMPSPPPPPPPPVGVQAVMASELNLTPEQREIFKLESEKFMKRSGEILRQYHQDKRNMLIELTKPYPDTLLLGHITAQLGMQQTRLERLMIRYFLNLKQICTPEQQQKFPEIIDRMLVKMSLERQVNTHLKKGEEHPNIENPPEDTD